MIMDLKQLLRIYELGYILGCGKTTHDNYYVARKATHSTKNKCKYKI